MLGARAEDECSPFGHGWATHCEPLIDYCHCLLLFVTGGHATLCTVWYCSTMYDSYVVQSFAYGVVLFRLPFSQRHNPIGPPIGHHWPGEGLKLLQHKISALARRFGRRGTVGMTMRHGWP